MLHKYMTIIFLFTDVDHALAMSRKKLENFQNETVSHASYSPMALMKFKLMELQQYVFVFFIVCKGSKFLAKIHIFFDKLDLLTCCVSIHDELKHRNTIFLNNGFIHNIRPVKDKKPDSFESGFSRL